MSKLFPKMGVQEQTKLIQSMTVGICDTFRKSNPEFQYEANNNPKRILTKPKEGVRNGGHDNENGDFILYVDGLIGPNEDPQRYQIIDMLGSGTYGQVVKCKNRETGELVSIKVLKNQKVYIKSGLLEEKILNKLNSVRNEENDHLLLQLIESFTHKNHLFLVCELLSFNLYQVMKANDFDGFPSYIVRNVTQQLLEAMVILKSKNIVHTDLKLENILLTSCNSTSVKIIDYGCACFQQSQTQTYVQSRFYRSPEVLLGHRYTSAIDMWSLGCIVAEIFLGYPLLPGHSEYNQLFRIIDAFGDVPEHMLALNEKAKYYYNVEKTWCGSVKFVLKNAEEVGDTKKPAYRFSKDATLKDLILKNPTPKKNMTFNEIERENKTRKNLIDFLNKIFVLDPTDRLTPEEALKHPFITGKDAYFTTAFGKLPPMTFKY